MEVDVGSLGFKIFPEMVRAADSLYADVKRHKEMGKDEGSPSERLPNAEIAVGRRGVICFLFSLVNG